MGVCFGFGAWITRAVGRVLHLLNTPLIAALQPVKGYFNVGVYFMKHYKTKLIYGTLALLSIPSVASAGVIDDLLGNVDISTVQATVTALGATIILVAFTIKAISVAKRVLGKI